MFSANKHHKTISFQVWPCNCFSDINNSAVLDFKKGKKNIKSSVPALLIMEYRISLGKQHSQFELRNWFPEESEHLEVASWQFLFLPL